MINKEELEKIEQDLVKWAENHPEYIVEAI